MITGRIEEKGEETGERSERGTPDLGANLPRQKKEREKRKIEAV